MRRSHTPKVTLYTPNYYSHNIHPRSPLHEAAAPVKIYHLALGHKKTNVINYYYSHGCFPHYNAMLRTFEARKSTIAENTLIRPPADYYLLPNNYNGLWKKSTLQIHLNSQHSQPQRSATPRKKILKLTPPSRQHITLITANIPNTINSDLSTTHKFDIHQHQHTLIRYPLIPLPLTNAQIRLGLTPVNHMARHTTPRHYRSKPRNPH